MPPLILTVYVLLCILAGYLGRSTRIGFWGCALISVFVTPVIAIPVLFLLGAARPRQG